MPASAKSLPSRSLTSSKVDSYTSKGKSDHTYLEEGGEGSWEEVSIVFRDKGTLELNLER